MNNGLLNRAKDLRLLEKIFGNFFYNDYLEKYNDDKLIINHTNNSIIEKEKPSENIEKEFEENLRLAIEYGIIKEKNNDRN